MRTLILIMGEGDNSYCLMTDEQIKRCKSLLKNGDWPNEVNTIIDDTRIKTGSVIEQCILSKDIINSGADGCCYIKNGA
jgi:hypothetical protein